MTVYVDDALIPYGRMLMSHLLADSEKELHLFADSLGLDRKWFQDKDVPHYDVSKSKRELALVLGAVPIKFGSKEETQISKRIRKLRRGGKW